MIVVFLNTKTNGALIVTLKSTKMVFAPLLLIISQIILDTIEDLNLSYPETDKARQKELQALRTLLDA